MQLVTAIEPTSKAEIKWKQSDDKSYFFPCCRRASALGKRGKCGLVDASAGCYCWMQALALVSSDFSKGTETVTIPLPHPRTRPL